MLPELDDEGYRPPFLRQSGKASAKGPQANGHHNGIPIVHPLRADEPRIPEADNAGGLGARPMHEVDLISLDQMLGPVRENDGHKDLQRALVPNRIQLVVEGRPAGGKTRMRSRVGACRCHQNARLDDYMLTSSKCQYTFSLTTKRNGGVGICI